MRTDNALMLDRSPDAFAELWERHQPKVLGWIRSQVHDPHQAEDLTQETFLRVYSADYSSDSFTGWLYQIARNLLVDHSRRQKSRPQNHTANISEDGIDPLPLMADRISEPGESIEVRDLTARVDELLPMLPDDQRTAFILYACCGMSLPEVSELMEACLPTTKSRVRLAREKLRDAMML